MNDLGELTKFATRYAEAWRSQIPESVAAFFAENGSLSINDGPPAVGRAAIAKVARGFMRDLPDMIVTKDDVTHESDGTKFHWTLTGTNTGRAARENAFASAATNSGRSTRTDSSQNRKAISTAPSTIASSKASDEL